MGVMTAAYNILVEYVQRPETREWDEQPMRASCNDSIYAASEGLHILAKLLVERRRKIREAHIWLTPAVFKGHC